MPAPVLNFRYIWRGFTRITRLSRTGAIVSYLILAIGGFFTLNAVYQVMRKPGEILAPFSDSFSKSPEATWESYGSLFEKHSTNIISAEFLAALAQIESDGNPIARTYWRWKWSWNPFAIYRPASSAVGMFQFTDGTFAEARKYCIHNHKVAVDGPWYDFDSCWFNVFYARNIPSHAIELTAAYLHQHVVDMLAARPTVKSNVDQKQKLAAVIHLCGASRGARFIKRRFRALAGERCGSHSLGRYLLKMDRMKKEFQKFRRSAESPKGN